MMDTRGLTAEQIRAMVLRDIAATESPDYQTIYGGGKFSDFSDHPRECVPIASGPNKGKCSTAAGRYQFLGSTWDEQAERLGLNDFGPDSQDAAAWDLAVRNYPGGEEALIAQVMQDKSTENVLPELSNIWTSLPGGIEQAGRYGGHSRGNADMNDDMISKMALLREFLPEEKIQKILEAANLPPEILAEQDLIDDTRSDIYRRGKSPRGQSTGGVYVAANPLEHIAHAAGNFMDNRKIAEARDRLEALRNDAGEARVMGNEAELNMPYQTGPAGPAGPAGPPPGFGGATGAGSAVAGPPGPPMPPGPPQPPMQPGPPGAAPGMGPPSSLMPGAPGMVNPSGGNPGMLAEILRNPELLQQLQYNMG